MNEKTRPTAFDVSCTDDDHADDDHQAQYITGRSTRYVSGGRSVRRFQQRRQDLRRWTADGIGQCCLTEMFGW